MVVGPMAARAETRMDTSCACDAVPSGKTSDADAGTSPFALQFALGNRRLPTVELSNPVLEGHRPDKVEMMNINRARVQFNQSEGKRADLDLLGPYLAHRRASGGEKKEMDEKVLALAEKLNVRVTEQPIISGVKPDKTTMPLADKATRVVVASQIISLVGKNKELYSLLMFEKEDNGFLGYFMPAMPKSALSIIVAKNNQMQGARGRSTGDHDIIINNDVLWGDVCPCDDHNTFIHELCHILDDGGEKRDGVLPQMGAINGGRFRRARQELYDRYREDYRRAFGVYPEDDRSPPPKSNPWWEQDADGDGVRNYVFFARDAKELKEQKEFVADTVKIFMEKPAVLKNASSSLYGVYADYFDVDPLKKGVSLA